MIKDIKKEVISDIRVLYQEDIAARTLFNDLAERARDATSTSIENVSRITTLSRNSSVALARRLEDANCGEFVVGRRGQKSRFKWQYSCISLARAAAGKSSTIEEPRDPAQDDDEGERNTPDVKELDTARNPGLTITQAKEQLAVSLGVSVSSIEITVRA